MRCGECGKKNWITQNVCNKWGMPWKDFPWVILTVDFELPVCANCGNTVIPSAIVREVDDALKLSILKSVSELIESIKKKYDLTLKEIANITGVTPQYISMLFNEKKVPSYQFVQLLRIINKHPEVLDEMQKEWKRA